MTGAPERRLLADLARGRIVRRVRSPLDDGPVYGVFAKDDRTALPTRTLAPQAIGPLLASGAVAANGDRLMLTDAGAAALRRDSSPSEPFLNQHRETATVRVCDAGGSGLAATANLLESPLAWLRARRDAAGRPLISASQYEAGTRLARDHHLGGLSPRVTAAWDTGGQSMRRRQGGRQPGGPDGAALDARARFHRALDAVGPELASLLVDICCRDTGLSDLERQRRWPRRTARVVLLLALDALARHYGLQSRRGVGGG